MARDILKMEWEVIGSSIQTVDQVKKRFDVSETEKLVNLSVAFNVGSAVANHIVRLHNERLTLHKELAP